MQRGDRWGAFVSRLVRGGRTRGGRKQRTRRASGLTLRMYDSARNTTVAVNVKAKAIHHAVVDIDVACETTLDIFGLLRKKEVGRG